MIKLILTYIDKKGAYRTGITCKNWIEKKGAYVKLLGKKKREFIKKKDWVGNPKPRKGNK